MGNENLMLISAAGFALTAILVHMLSVEKSRMIAAGVEAQRTTLDHKLAGNPLDGFETAGEVALLCCCSRRSCC